MLRRRIYLMRHGDVAYFDELGRPFPADEVPLTALGQDQARAAGAMLSSVHFDRVVTSGLTRTLQTVRLVLEGREDVPALEVWPELHEIRAGRLASIPDDELEEAFLGAFRGVPAETVQFLGGETVGAFLDRVLPGIQRFVADPDWKTALLVLHGGVNRAILTYALTGQRMVLGGLEQAPACINVIDVAHDWVIQAVNLCPYDLLRREARMTTVEELLHQYRRTRGGQRDAEPGTGPA